MLISVDSLRASICRDSFFDFVKTFWKVVIPEEPVWNWHIEYLCHELQVVTDRVIENKPREYDLIINISPGSTKSTLCSVMLPAWFWARMPSGKTVCASYAHHLALELSRRCRVVVQSELYSNLFPEVNLTEDQNTKGYFVTDQGGGRIAVGTGGSITGFHGHLIIIDDPIDPLGTNSKAELDSANIWMRETIPTRKVSKSLCPTILIMQRLSDNDPTGEMLSRNKEGVRHICLPAELSDNVSPPEARRFYTDGLFDPVRMPREVLKEQERELGEYAYSGQFLQSPVPRQGGFFKIERILIEPPPKSFVERVRFWDKAGTYGDGAYTVGVLMGKSKDGRYWVLDVVRGQWDSSRREDIIAQTAMADGKGVRIGVEQEPGSGGKESAENTIRNLAGFSVRAERPTGDKMVRADPFASQLNSGNVSLSPGSWNREYLEELRHFSGLAKYKDQVDASSGAFGILSKRRKRVGGVRW